jgi:hypothetical protein
VVPDEVDLRIVHALGIKLELVRAEPALVARLSQDRTVHAVQDLVANEVLVFEISRVDEAEGHRQ